MAAVAMEDQKKRVVQVDRYKLIGTLVDNRERHLVEYREAVDGYKAMAIEKLKQAHESAKLKLEKNLSRGIASLEEFDPGKPSNSSDYLVLVEGLTVQLKVPRDYSKQYDAAIDIAKWDVRDTLELTHAEFQCFVRDEWDWSSDFRDTTAIYNSKKMF